MGHASVFDDAKEKMITGDQLGELEKLIDQLRAIRLSLVKLSTFETLAEPAKAGVEALSKASAELERMSELVVSAQVHKRRRRRKASDQPTLPKLEEESKR